VLTIGGLIIMSTGVMGLYVGRVFNEVRGRPLYVIDEHSEGAFDSETSVSEREELAR
jgi:dolichol-phosphate mannosyltransferase